MPYNCRYCNSRKRYRHYKNSRNSYINIITLYYKKRDRPAMGTASLWQVGDYSFTPPTAMPAMMYLLKAKYTMISGSAVMVRPR